MWDAIRRGNIPGIQLGSKALFSAAGHAGPRRLLVIGVIGASVAALMVALTFSGRHRPPFSFDARMQPVDPLPGGLHSTPEQDALAYRADTAQARAAQLRGASYTPPIAPSTALQEAAPEAEAPAPGGVVAAPPQPRFVRRPARVYPAASVVPPVAFEPMPAVATAPPPAAVSVAQPLDDAQQQAYTSK